ncbi:MAG: GNAT family N-acetyltransferase [Actinobacteria bacterium]|nr:GNAT family N-acetyltransferase [Actinomycetota bacterium]
MNCSVNKESFSIQIDTARLRLRSLHLSDLSDTLCIRNASRDGFIDRDEVAPNQHLGWFGEYLQRPGDLFFVARFHPESLESGRIVGQVSLYDIAYGSAEFGRLAVSPRLRRLGYGLEIVESVVDFAACIGVATLHLRVLRENAPAIALYEKAGFRRIEMPGPDPAEVVFMEAHL